MNPSMCTKHIGPDCTEPWYMAEPRASDYKGGDIQDRGDHSLMYIALQISQLFI